MTATPARRAEPGSAQESISDQEIARRKAFLDFGDQDIQLLKELHRPFQECVDEVVEGLYRHLLSFEETRAFFRDPQVLDRVKRTQKKYFVELTQGDYDTAYLEDRINIGRLHERIGLDPKWYLGTYNFYLRAAMLRIFHTYREDQQAALDHCFALLKLVFLDMDLAISTYILRRERTMLLQQEAIRQLSTPVLQLREGLLILPVIGIVDTQRARQMTEQLLHAIRANRAKIVILDVTGLAVVDSAVANHLLQTVQAARLLGARVIVTGLSAENAQTLVRIGVDLSALVTAVDLQSGMELAQSMLEEQMGMTEQAPKLTHG